MAPDEEKAEVKSLEDVPTAEVVIGTGTSLARGVPSSTVISYILVGMAMAAFVPMNKGFSGYAGRMVDAALGFATGWNYFLKYIVTAPTNLTASGLVVQYWRPDLNVAIWITIFGLVIIASNLFHVKHFGEMQFWFSCAKVIIMAVLIIGCVVIALGGGPNHHRVGFAYWENPGAFAAYLVEGNKGRFLGWWAAMCKSCWAYAGTEVVGMTFGETPNPRKNIPRAVKQTFWRISVFYILSVLVLGMAVPYNNDKLIGATKQATSDAASPFVVAFSLAGVEAMGDFVNASLLIFTLSASSSDIYCASRSLYGLAKDGQAPKIFAKATTNGVPVYATIAASVFCALGYLNASKSASQVFEHLVSVVTVFAVLNWMAILISYLGFRRSIKAQGIPVKSLPNVGPLQPWGAYYALFLSLLVTVFNGYDAFIPHLKPADFVLKYIGTVIFIANFAWWKSVNKTEFYKRNFVDLFTGRREFQEQETADDQRWNESWWKTLQKKVVKH
ncbi:amino acid permease/ SLC12A domain-containing protein [Thelonectria olida]|uniref:Amino acid permease/ SLC12A domain-containing protein n=1 Tax=Thelonectria olida TaxID=1576542 RepID=A0A9P8VXA9_9HYPO|nr:amino acid permease/ SLC12A domain-containing protein [Thelonectria olida]